MIIKIRILLFNLEPQIWINILTKIKLILNITYEVVI